jgi:hypothetical protein
VLTSDALADAVPPRTIVREVNGLTGADFGANDRKGRFETLRWYFLPPAELANFNIDLGIAVLGQLASARYLVGDALELR